MDKAFTVYGAAGSGSVPVEATLTLLGLPYGAVMTESAAILIWLADTYAPGDLAPLPHDPKRRDFLRWMVFIPAAIYSMFWVRDVPSRLAGDDPAQQKLLEARTAERIAQCWRAMGDQLKPAGDHLLGDRLTVLDLYVATASRWTPRRRRFYAEAPALADPVRRVDADPRLQGFWPQRFPFNETYGWDV